MAVEIKGRGGIVMVVLSGSTNHKALDGLMPALAVALSGGDRIVVDVRDLALDDPVDLDQVFGVFSEFGSQFRLLSVPSGAAADGGDGGRSSH